MPASPPGGGRNRGPLSSNSSIIVRTADSTTDDELLHLIENARSAVARAREATAGPSNTSTLNAPGGGGGGSIGDSAATSLFERHASRREMELEWDERDTERRARELMARLEQNPPPGNLVDVDDHSSGEFDDDAVVRERINVGGRAFSAGELFGLPTFGGIIPDSDDDDDDDRDIGLYDPTNAEEAIFGFDGDDDDELEEDEIRMLNDDIATYGPRLGWPGLVGERPLNAEAPTLSGPVELTPKPPSQPNPSLDPSSSTSFTSFLSPGTTFIGQQVTSARSSTRRHISTSRLNRSSERSRPTSTSTTEYDQVSTAHPAFAPPRSARQDNPYQYYVSPSNPSTTDWTPNFLGPLRPSSSNSASFGPNHSNLSSATDTASTTARTASSSSSSSRYAPYSSHTAVGNPSTTSAATIPSAPIPPNLTPVERARLSIARNINPGARSNPASWRQVADELLVRLRTADDETTPNVGEGDTARRSSNSTRTEERWEVQVNIQSYDPTVGKVTGLMSAYGIQSSQRDLSTHPTRVTTFFSASILQPLSTGLFVSPSPTGSGGSSPEGIKVSQSTEAESWTQVGPFKGMKKNELLQRAKSWNWVEEKSRGWVLMRWKERDFINVKATESSLSINGFYFVALNRSTGVIEGLYSDPASSPYQRLDLTPCNSEGTFSLATYSMC